MELPGQGAQRNNVRDFQRELREHVENVWASFGCLQTSESGTARPTSDFHQRDAVCFEVLLHGTLAQLTLSRRRLLYALADSCLHQAALRRTALRVDPATHSEAHPYTVVVLFGSVRLFSVVCVCAFVCLFVVFCFAFVCLFVVWFVCLVWFGLVWVGCVCVCVSVFFCVYVFVCVVLLCVGVVCWCRVFVSCVCVVCVVCVFLFVC